MYQLDKTHFCTASHIRRELHRHDKVPGIGRRVPHRQNRPHRHKDLVSEIIVCTDLQRIRNEQQKTAEIGVAAKTVTRPN